MIETDDEAVVQAKVDAIVEALCGPEHLLEPDHQCDPPWFIVRRALSRKKAKRWRSLMSR